MKHHEGDIPIARAYLEQHAKGKQWLVMDLLAVWETEVGDQELQREARTLAYGLKSTMKAK